MAKEELKLSAALYDSEDQARRILDGLHQMHKGSTITLKDLAMITRDADGKLAVKETREVTAKKGAKRGAIATGVFAVLFPPSIIASALVGGGAGAIWGRLRDTGIKGGELKDFGETIKPGKAGVIALSAPQYVPEIERTLNEWNAELVAQGAAGVAAEPFEAAAAEEQAAP